MQNLYQVKKEEGMKILSGWIYKIAGYRARLIEFTESEKAQLIPLTEFLQEPRRDPDENKDLCENKPDK